MTSSPQPYPIHRAGSDAARRRHQRRLARLFRQPRPHAAWPRITPLRSALHHDSARTPKRTARSSLPERPSSAWTICTPRSPIPKPASSPAVRGGYGSNYLLHGLDLDLIRKHPKPFFAYSDLTGIQLRLLDQLGLPAFHGPMVAADFSRRRRAPAQLSVCADRASHTRLGAFRWSAHLKPGRARGTLYGGCLSILVSLLGTPWEPTTEGKLLFLEDTGVKPYQIDRMLWQLQQAGKLDGVRGIIFGEMLDCVSPGASPQLLEDVILHAFSSLEIPIAIGLRSGHVSRQNVTLIFGIETELRASDEPQLHLLQPAVAS